MARTSTPREGRRSFRRPVRAALLGLLVLGVLAAGASAFWTGTSTGAASTAVSDGAQPLTFTAGAPSAGLFPGGTAGVEIAAHNPNPVVVQLAGLVLDGAITVDAVHGDAGCDVSALSFVPQDNDGDGWSIPPRVGATDGTLDIEMDNALTMSDAAGNACQGATFTVLLTAQN